MVDDDCVARHSSTFVLKALLYVQCTVCVKELITLMIFYIYIVQFNTSKHKSHQILWNNRRTTLHQ